MEGKWELMRVPGIGIQEFVLLCRDKCFVLGIAWTCTDYKVLRSLL